MRLNSQVNQVLASSVLVISILIKGVSWHVASLILHWEKSYCSPTISENLPQLLQFGSHVALSWSQTYPCGPLPLCGYIHSHTHTSSHTHVHTTKKEQLTAEAAPTVLFGEYTYPARWILDARCNAAVSPVGPGTEWCDHIHNNFHRLENYWDTGQKGYRLLGWKNCTEIPSLPLQILWSEAVA